jgi:hypothetical protein
MKNLKFLPIKEEFKPYPAQEFYSEFRLDFLTFAITMFDMVEYQKLYDYKVKTERKIKNYVLMLAFPGRSWLFYTNDNYVAAKTMYRTCIDSLKQGDTWEFTDDLSARPGKPIRKLLL